MKLMKQKIEESKKIIITTHVNPDGDGIGAGLALLMALKKMGKTAEFVIQDSVPKNLGFLAGIKEIKTAENIKVKDFDLAIAVDAATYERLGCVTELVKGIDLINIDHHISNNAYGNINLIDNVSSACEIMYGVIHELGIEIDLPMGEALYAGIVNDTGNFAHDNVTKKTMEIAAKLIGIGVKNSKVVRELFQNKSYAALKIMGNALSKMTFVPEKKFVYYYISYEKLTKLGGSKEDTEGLVERINSLEDSNVSLFLREEKNGTIKGSMRSKIDTDVNAIAQIFGGGGHYKAAGFSSELPPETIIEKVLEKL